MQDNTPKGNETSNEGLSGETRNFDPVEQKKDGSGSTKTFDKVNNGADKGKSAENAPKKKKKKKETKTAKAAKATVSGVVFTFRKVLTYALNVLLTVLIVGIITAVVVGGAFLIYLRNYVDPTYSGLDNLEFDSALSTTMYYVDENGKEILLEGDTLESSENRLWADYKDIPATLINAYIAVEDKRFGELDENKNIIGGHNGVDTTRTASAIYNFFIPTSSNYGGGSTITQQLIKNVSGENETTIQRKVQEIFRAYDVESKFTKEQIMEMYLNTIYLSHNSYGVRVAAETYFGKELDELTLGECAAIASIGKWPIHYDPIANPQNNLERRNLVLQLMLEQEMITEEEFNEFYDAPITLADGSEEEYSETIHSYYIDAVMDDVIADLMDQYGYDKVTASKVLYSGGLQIVTCLDPVIQECAEKIYEDSSYWPEKSGMQAQSAICIMDPETGDILGLVGGLGEKRESRGFNRATHAYRQCGSSIKPVSVYALALDSGYYTGGSSVDDVPFSFTTSGRAWPSNAGRSYRGRVSLDYAIQASLNTIAVSTCDGLGIRAVYDNFKDYGYTTLVDTKTLDDGTVLSDVQLSPLALGGLTYGVTVRDHTQAYATLANGGITSKARTYSVVRDSTGKVLLDNREQHTVKYSESSTAVLTELLTHVVNGPSGTATSVINIDSRYGIDVAGKTGTTNDNKDVYFSGYTPDFVACVWYGYDNNKTVSHGNASAVLWNSVFNEIYKYYDEHGIEYTKEFYVPSSVVTDVEYCTVSGKLATDACRKDLYDAQGGSSVIAHGTFTTYDVPTEYCDKHIMVKWDQVTGALCLDGCACPAENLIEVGMRLYTFEDRMLEKKAYVGDAQYVYMEVPQGYVYPTDPNVPFFQNALPEGYEYAFGISTSEKPVNRVCSEHLPTAVPEGGTGTGGTATDGTATGETTTTP